MIARRKARVQIAYARPVGEAHWNAILSDHEVELLIALRKEGMTFVWLAEKFEVSPTCCRDICSGRRRGLATGIAWRRR